MNCIFLVQVKYQDYVLWRYSYNNVCLNTLMKQTELRYKNIQTAERLLSGHLIVWIAQINFM